MHPNDGNFHTTCDTRRCSTMNPLTTSPLRTDDHAHDRLTAVATLCNAALGDDVDDMTFVAVVDLVLALDGEGAP